MKPLAFLAAALLAGCASPPIVKLPFPNLVTVGSKTHSMEPVLHGGERLVRLPIKIKDVRVGYVVSCYQNHSGNEFIHAVVAVKTDGGEVVGLICKGYNNRFQDEQVSTERELLGYFPTLSARQR